MPKKLLLTAGMIVILSSAASPTLPSTQIGPPEVRQSQQERDMEQRQLKELNKRRQQDIRDDTTKLFELATELKAAVDKSNENLLSLEVVRKADEVEKLAHKVKEKMRESVGPAPTPLPLPTPRFP